MRIRRSYPEDNFFIAPNETFRDERLTFAARGLLSMLLTHSDGWEVNSETLWRIAQQKREKKAEGRRAIRAALAELEECGYLVRRRVQGDRGRWHTETEVSDTPAHRSTAFATSAGDASGGPASVSATLKRSTKEEEPSKEELSKEHSSALVDTRAAADAARNLDQALDQLYDMVNRLNDQALRNALLNFERKRPRIYRECRNDAIEQIENDSGPASLKAQNAGRAIDSLSYKYALKHYAPDWPGWLIRPLGVG